MHLTFPLITTSAWIFLDLLSTESFLHAIAPSHRITCHNSTLNAYGQIPCSLFLLIRHDLKIPIFHSTISPLSSPVHSFLHPSFYQFVFKLLCSVSRHLPLTLSLILYFVPRIMILFTYIFFFLLKFSHFSKCSCFHHKSKTQWCHWYFHHCITKCLLFFPNLF